MNEELIPFAPACERNKQPILEALQSLLPDQGRVLEIGSGTGQHMVHFSSNLQHLEWQPSERLENLPGLNMRLQLEAGVNVLPAIELDVGHDWPKSNYQAVISANTAHIMGWPEVECMFAGIAAVLDDGGIFCLYGPFNEKGRFTSSSNEEFDQQLKLRDSRMGLRDVGDLDRLAFGQQMTLEQQLLLPANNQILVFRRRRQTS